MQKEKSWILLNSNLGLWLIETTLYFLTVNLQVVLADREKNISSVDPNSLIVDPKEKSSYILYRAECMAANKKN